MSLQTVYEAANDATFQGRCPATPGLLDQLMAGGVISEAQRDGLRAMATVADVVTCPQVQAAMQGGN